VTIDRNARHVSRHANRWWSAPVRFSASALDALRHSAARSQRDARSWLAQSPVGIRSPLDAPG
jgi:hypothetical protein